MRPTRWLLASLLTTCLAVAVDAGADPSRASRPNDEVLQKEHKPVKNYTRALEEYAVTSGLFGIPWYWATQNFNQRNWDLKWDWHSWKRKTVTFDAVRFDGDDFNTNSFKHPFMSGTADWMIARTNHLSIPESFGMAALNSVAWEYLVEFREGPSVNDMITTPFAGMAIGEVLFQLGEYFDRGGDQPVNWALANVFGALQGLHARMDNRVMSKSHDVDDLGFALDRWHRFQLSAAMAQAWLLGASETRMQLGLDTEIIGIPSYGKPGHVHRWVNEENITRLSAGISFDEKGLQQGVVRVLATLAGYYQQDIEGSRRAGIDGHALFTGVHAAFEYSKTHLGSYEDSLAIMSIFGLSADLTLHSGPLRVRARLDAAPQFGMVSAFAGPAYVASLPPGAVEKTTLQLHNYYYSFGAGVAPSLEVELPPFVVGGSARFEQFNSLDGFERNMAAVTNDAHFTDRRLSERVFVALRPAAILQFTASVEERLREGKVGAFEASLRERIVTFGASFLL